MVRLAAEILQDLDQANLIGSCLNPVVVIAP
jgi:hypothetical protein